MCVGWLGVWENIKSHVTKLTQHKLCCETHLLIDSFTDWSPSVSQNSCFTNDWPTLSHHKQHTLKLFSMAWLVDGRERYVLWLGWVSVRLTLYGCHLLGKWDCNKREKVILSRLMRVILAQGPCQSSLYRSNFNGCLASQLQRSSSKLGGVPNSHKNKK